MAYCSKDTNGSQFNFQEPCQWLIGGKDTNGSV